MRVYTFALSLMLKIISAKQTRARDSPRDTRADNTRAQYATHSEIRKKHAYSRIRS